MPRRRVALVLAALVGAAACSSGPTDTGAGSCSLFRSVIVLQGDTLGGRCLPRPLDVDPATGDVACSVVENLEGASDCTRAGRVDLSQLDNGKALRADAETQLRGAGACDTAGKPDCSALVLCAVQQLDTSSDPQALSACQSQDPAPAGIGGFCYVADNASGQQIGNPDLVTNCPPTEQQLLRIIGADASATGEFVIACANDHC